MSLAELSVVAGAAILVLKPRDLKKALKFLAKLSRWWQQAAHELQNRFDKMCMMAELSERERSAKIADAAYQESQKHGS